MSTTTYPTADALRAATPPKGSGIAFTDDENYRRHKHREVGRRIASLDGDEWIIGSTELKSEREFKTGVTANWFAKGESNSAAKPAVHLKMSVSHRTDKPPSPWGDFPAKAGEPGVGRDEFMAYWSALTGTVRPRPSAF